MAPGDPVAVNRPGGSMRICVVAPSAACLWLLAAFVSVPQASGADAADPTQYRAVIDQYCVGCHSDSLKTGGISLQSVDLAQPWTRADIFEKVIGKVHGGMMPPVGLPRPDKATADGLVTAL